MSSHSSPPPQGASTDADTPSTLWQPVQDPSSGAWYCWNVQTGETSWDLPTESSSSVTAEQPPLPPEQPPLHQQDGQQSSTSESASPSATEQQKQQQDDDDVEQTKAQQQQQQQEREEHERKLPTFSTERARMLQEAQEREALEAQAAEYAREQEAAGAAGGASEDYYNSEEYYRWYYSQYAAAASAAAPGVGATATAAGAAAAVPADTADSVFGLQDYTLAATFNSRTGRFQPAATLSSNFTPAQKAHRQMSYYFDVDKYQEERNMEKMMSGTKTKEGGVKKKLTRKELEMYKAKAKEKKMRSLRMRLGED
ncbi:hypothetical protein HDV05_007163 [Chytridiales sp. JEL 0842]|nr:hypothetical protein HDV05_007163 [Chytridiales sp. JEL 0842]